MESQQLHYQLQRVQQEEIENKPEGTIPPPEQQPRKSDQIRRRLMELDHNMKQVVLLFGWNLKSALQGLKCS